MKTILLLSFLAVAAHSAVTVKFVNSEDMMIDLTQVFPDGLEWIHKLKPQTMICMHLTEDGEYKFHKNAYGQYMIVFNTTQQLTTFRMSAIESKYDIPIAITPLKNGVPCGKPLECKDVGCHDVCWSDDEIEEKTRKTTGDEIEVNWRPEIRFKKSKICPKKAEKVRKYEETSVYDYY